MSAVQLCVYVEAETATSRPCSFPEGVLRARVDLVARKDGSGNVDGNVT